MVYCATFKGLNDELRQEATHMKKQLSEDAMVITFAAGVLGASLIIGLVFFYGLDKVF